MAVKWMLAQMTVVELEVSVAWYARLFGRQPDDRPMEGLAEWYLDETFGVQVWAEPGRAGRSTMVLDESDLDVRAAYLEGVGIEHVGPWEASKTRIVQVRDPDGNRVVFTGTGCSRERLGRDTTRRGS